MSVRAATITEFQEWCKKPEVLLHFWLTGAIGSRTDFASDYKDVELPKYDAPGRTSWAKYLTPSIDTRDMTIWRLGASGGGEETVVRDGMEGEGTILDLMLKKLNEESRNAIR